MKLIAIVLALGIVALQTSPDNPRNHTTSAGAFHDARRRRPLGNPWEVTWGPDGYLWVTSARLSRDAHQSR
jgi:hypothetical protein